METGETVYLDSSSWRPSELYGTGEEVSEGEFWQDIVSGLLNLVCIIERAKLKREHTTADLRKAGKKALYEDGSACEYCGATVDVVMFFADGKRHTMCLRGNHLEGPPMTVQCAHTGMVVEVT